MNEIVDKLLLLDYSNSFLVDFRLKPISRSQFLSVSASSNSSGTSNFYYCTSLIWWIIYQIQSADSTFEFTVDKPGQFDDPNVICQQLIDSLLQLGDDEIRFEGGPLKLRQAVGDEVIDLINKLLDKLLKLNSMMPSVDDDTPSTIGPSTGNPGATTDIDKDVVLAADANCILDSSSTRRGQVDDDGETIGDEIDDEVDDEVEDEMEDGMVGDSFVIGQEVVSTKPNSIPPTSQFAGSDSFNADVDSGYDLEHLDQSVPEIQKLPIPISEKNWSLEIERVTPLLKVTVGSDNKDWRIHFQQLQQSHTAIESNTGEIRKYMRALSQNVDSTLEKIESREKYINSQLDSHIQQFKHVNAVNEETKGRASQLNETVSDLSADLVRVSDELDALQSQMDDLGSGMTDPKPLVEIKTAKYRLESDITDMEAKIALLRYEILHKQLNEYAAIERDLQKGRAVSVGDL